MVGILTKLEVAITFIKMMNYKNRYLYMEKGI